ncbi:sensor histidine kinase [Catelliglobosispora koreensis]|uniref:sensor histidine kinase n=1 Tax=Catelliglobosispora koreensis TaxID=129052 RepID=UPI00036B8117|nr:histidine kinase [Catelliglobosispora koreensis]
MSVRRVIVALAVVSGWWVAWGLIDIINLGQMHLAGGEPAPWAHLWRTSMASNLLWIPTTLAALWLAARWPLGRTGIAGIGVHVLGLAATVFGRAVVVALFNPFIGWYAEAVPPFGELMMISVYNNLFLYGLITIGAHALYYARAHREREAQLTQASLHALRTQLQPHFLFNTLNAIAAHVHDDPDTAERMIAGLGDLLRHSLDSDGRLLVPLDEELAVLRSYVDIEQIRFADRLTVTWDIDPGTLPAAVPPLLLQPLAENAIRHGLWPRSAPGVLAISARHNDGQLLLTISDDGVGIAAEAAHGIGLSNTAARLRRLYAGKHDFRVRPGQNGGTVATIRLPFSVITGDDSHPGDRRRAAGPAPVA